MSTDLSETIDRRIDMSQAYDDLGSCRVLYDTFLKELESENNGPTCSKILNSLFVKIVDEMRRRGLSGKVELKDVKPIINDAGLNFLLDPTDWKTFLLNGWFQHWVMDDKDKSLSNIDNIFELLKEESTHKSSTVFPILHYMRGLCYRCLKKWDEAGKEYTKCTNLAPDFPEAYYGLAYIEMIGKENYEDGNKLCDKVIEYRPNHHGALYFRAYYLHVSVGLEEAMVAYEKLIEAPREEGRTKKGTNYYKAMGYRYRACMYSEKKNFELAFYDFNESIKLDPDAGETYFFQGHFYIEHRDSKGRKRKSYLENAVTCFTEAIRLKNRLDLSYYYRAKTHESLGSIVESEKIFSDLSSLDQRDHHKEAAAHDYLKVCQCTKNENLRIECSLLRIENLKSLEGRQRDVIEACTSLLNHYDKKPMEKNVIWSKREEVYMYRGNAYFELDEWKIAEEHLSNSLEIIGRKLKDERERFDLRQLEETKGLWVRVLARRGHCHHLLGNIDSAADDLVRAAEMIKGEILIMQEEALALSCYLVYSVYKQLTDEDHEKKADYLRLGKSLYDRAFMYNLDEDPVNLRVAKYGVKWVRLKLKEASEWDDFKKLMKKEHEGMLRAMAEAMLEEGKREEEVKKKNEEARESFQMDPRSRDEQQFLSQLRHFRNIWSLSFLRHPSLNMLEELKEEEEETEGEGEGEGAEQVKLLRETLNVGKMLGWEEKKFDDAVVTLSEGLNLLLSKKESGSGSDTRTELEFEYSSCLSYFLNEINLPLREYDSDWRYLMQDTDQTEGVRERDRQIMDLLNRCVELKPNCVISFFNRGVFKLFIHHFERVPNTASEDITLEETKQRYYDQFLKDDPGTDFNEALTMLEADLSLSERVPSTSTASEGINREEETNQRYYDQILHDFNEALRMLEADQITTERDKSLEKVRFLLARSCVYWLKGKNCNQSTEYSRRKEFFCSFGVPDLEQAVKIAENVSFSDRKKKNRYLSEIYVIVANVHQETKCKVGPVYQYLMKAHELVPTCSETLFSIVDYLRRGIEDSIFPKETPLEKWLKKAIVAAEKEEDMEKKKNGYLRAFDVHLNTLKDPERAVDDYLRLRNIDRKEGDPIPTWKDVPLNYSQRRMLEGCLDENVVGNWWVRKVVKSFQKDDIFDEETEKVENVQLMDQLYGKDQPDGEENKNEELRKKKQGLAKRYTFEIFRQIGKGAYGVTYLCRIQGVLGIFVMKLFLDLCKVTDEQMWKEMAKKEDLKLPFHRNIVPILYCSRSPEILDVENFPDYESFWKKRLRRMKKKLKKLKKKKKASTTPSLSSPTEFRTGLVIMRYHRKDLYRYCFERLYPKHETGVIEKDAMPFSNLELCYMMEGILKGAYHLHKNMIVHRDLHLGNIFVDEDFGRIYIGDFGCALDLRDNPTGFKVSRKLEIMFSVAPGGVSQTIKRGGYALHLAPEIVDEEEGEDTFFDYTKSDLFSVGMVGYKLSTLKIKWSDEGVFGDAIEDSNLGEVFGKEKRCFERTDEDYVEIPESRCCKEVSGLIRKLLRVDPRERIGFVDAIEEVKGIMSFLEKRDKKE